MQEKVLMKGNEALAEAAILAHLKLREEDASDFVE